MFTEYSRLRAATLNAAVHTEFQDGVIALLPGGDKGSRTQQHQPASKKARFADHSSSSKAAAGASAADRGASSTGAGSGQGAGSGKHGDCPYRTKQQVEHCRVNGLCLRCYKSGHRKDQCKADKAATGDPPGMKNS